MDKMLSSNEQVMYVLFTSNVHDIIKYLFMSYLHPMYSVHKTVQYIR